MVEKTNVFQFMLVRAPELPAAHAVRQGLIRDELLGRTGLTDRDLFSANSASEIGKLLYRIVFCSDEEPEFTRDFSYVLSALLGLLPYFRPGCPQDGDGDGDGLRLVELRDRHSFTLDGLRYVVPDRLEDVPGAPLLQYVLDAREALAAALAEAAGGDKELDLKSLLRELRSLRDGIALRAVVFDEAGRLAELFAETRRALFDHLYLLYVLRRQTTVNLEHVIDGLRALHALQALAIDEFLESLGGGGAIIVPDQNLLNSLGAVYPVLRRWRPGKLPPGFPLIAGADDLAAHLQATPVVHPLFAQLHRFRTPFNPIRPLGIGDLKVVKQWLCGYKVGEIAHIENVLKSENRSRVHRHLERTEDVFSTTSEDVTETQQDTQTTDRFELKRETENLVKSDLNVNAALGLNITYNNPGGYAIVSTVSGGFAYTRSQTDQTKVSSNYAREVVDKAVKRVQSRVSQQRTTTKIFETEETNTHGFDNSKGNEHISGIYRWLDKEYRAQVYNYGKRMMFEFLVPEPAAFLVESRLRAFEATLDVPRPPIEPTPAALPDWLVKLEASQIDDDQYAKLSRDYDLADLPPPLRKRSVQFVDAATNKSQFAESGIDSSIWQTRSFNCHLNAKDYQITKLAVKGYLYFYGREGLPTDKAGNPADVNTFEIFVDGQQLHQIVDNTRERWWFQSGSFPGNVGGEFGVNGSLPLAADDVTLTFGFWDIAQFDLSVEAELELSAAALGTWQRQVLARVMAAERKRVDERNRQQDQAYEAALATYHNRLDELRAVAVNDLLQGRSEAANRQLIMRELKREVLAMLTKEFDADAGDDQLTDLDAMGTRQVASRYRRMVVKESPAGGPPQSATASFETLTTTVDFPLPSLDKARAKGRYVQFLEQAFEWPQLSYNCYPYFWSTPPRWIELMNRGDDVDPNLSAFLQAGYAKVVVAVTPAYDDAVLHWLATGEPWDGGPAPVIGDPLYIPLYQELRKQTDDLANATPEGTPWTFLLPTSLVYLENSSTKLPPSECDPAKP